MDITKEKKELIAFAFLLIPYNNLNSAARHISSARRVRPTSLALSAPANRNPKG